MSRSNKKLKGKEQSQEYVVFVAPEDTSLMSRTRLRGLSLITKTFIALAVFLVLAVIATLIYWMAIRDSWSDQQIMLRILTGEVEINATPGKRSQPATDNTWLKAGDVIEAKQGSLALLQYFEGSTVQIKGPAELHLTYSRGLGGQLPDGLRMIGLDVLRGGLTVSATEQRSLGSLFEIQTPGSAGQVGASLFELEVNKEGGAIWELSKGTVTISAMTADENLEAVVVLIPLNAGNAISIPPLPLEWEGDRIIRDALINAASEIAKKSLQEDHSDVQIVGASLLALNRETGSAIFGLEKTIKPAAAILPAPDLPIDYEAVNDEVLQQKVPVLSIARPLAPKSLFIPALPVPDIWAASAPTHTVTNPPKYLFSIDGIDKPMGVSVDPGGQRVCVTERGGERVTRVFDSDGKQIMVLYPPGTVEAERDPFYVAINRVGTVYVSDRVRQTIDMYDVNGTYLGAFMHQGDPDIPWSPLGLALDFSDNLYITDITESSHRVLKFSPSGELKLELGHYGGDRDFAFPNDVAIDMSGRIFVADTNNLRIQVFDAQGQLLIILAGQAVGLPRGIETEDHYLYVVDIFGHTVHVFNVSQGIKPVFDFGERGAVDGTFNFPNDLAIDAEGRLYITDRDNNRVQVWSY